MTLYLKNEVAFKIIQNKSS